MHTPDPLRLSVRSLVGCWTLFAVTAVGRGQSTNSPPIDAASLAKYDLNKNGVLDPSERAAMAAAEAGAGNARADKTGIVQLSPFTVDAGSDRGYLAANTLSGTRLNSKLQDLASSITVVTKQQLLDTAAVDINDIFLYEAGTEGIGQFTDPTNDGRGTYDNVAGSPATANRVRGLGAANVAVGGFSVNSSIPIDTYNIDSVEISRGPNTNIFGLGDPSGTININRAEANVTREVSSVTVRGDSYDGFRTSIDLNRPIFKNKLALRFSALYAEVGYVRKPSLDRTDRGQIALTYKPFRDTKITGSYESYHNFNSRANSETPRDTIAYWRGHGRPTWNPVTQVATVNGVPFNAATAPITNDANLPAGLSGIGSTKVRLQELIDQGKVLYIAPGQNPTPAAGTGFTFGNNQRLVFSGTEIQRGGGGAIFGGGPSLPLYAMPETTDKSIYNWTAINTAAPNYNRMRADIFNVNIEQWLINTPRHVLALQAGWYREDVLEYRRSFVAQQDGVPAILQLDTNEVLLDGSPNPYFLRPFFGGNEPQVYRKPSFADDYRLVLAYQLDLTHENNFVKWLGRHRFSGYGEYREEMKSPNGLRDRDQVIDNPHYVSATGILGSAGGHLYPRYFLGNTKGGGIEYANTGAVNPTGNFRVAYLDPATGIWNYNDPVAIKEVYFSQGLQKKKIRTDGLTLQSFFLEDEIIPTVGYRKDRVYFIDNLPLVTLPNGLIDTTNLYNFGTNKKWNQGNTATKGIVVRPFKRVQPLERMAASREALPQFFGELFHGMDFFYNSSDSFQPADIAYNVQGDVLANPTGKGKDYGVAFHLLHDNLYIKINKFDTYTTNARSTLGTIAGRSLRLDFALSSTGTPDNFSLFPNAIGWYTILHPEWTPAQVQDAAVKLTQLSPDYIASVQNKSISDSNDAQSKGYEVELNYTTPSRFWTVKVTGSQTEAIDSHLSHFVQDHVNERLPVWTSVIDPVSGLNWWTENNNAAVNFYTVSVLAPLRLGIANEGKKKPQTREYAMSALTSFQLAAIAGDRAWLRAVSVGGNYRWASESAIGYLGGAPESDGVVRSYDANKPVFDKATVAVNVFATYRLKLFHERIGATLQLNINNINESGRLQPIAVNPDGQISRYRIIDPRQYIASVRFDL